MNIGEIKAVVKKYFTGGDFTGSPDVVLDALNVARVEAMQRRDFEVCFQMAKASVGSGGTLLTGFTDMSGGVYAGVVNSVRNAWILGSDGVTLREVDLVSKGTLQARQRRLGEEMLVRYPSDADVAYSGYEQVAYRDGTKMFVYPSTTTAVTLVVDACVWPKTYSADADTDFLTEQGFNYLKWAAIAELNPIYKEFVARQEGNVGEGMIEQRLARAWDALERWDAFLVDGNVPVTT